jgi:hypothetical protein
MKLTIEVDLEVQGFTADEVKDYLYDELLKIDPKIDDSGEEDRTIFVKSFLVAKVNGRVKK